jgi:hypothetical protein
MEVPFLVTQYSSVMMRTRIYAYSNLRYQTSQVPPGSGETSSFNSFRSGEIRVKMFNVRKR